MKESNIFIPSLFTSQPIQPLFRDTVIIHSDNYYYVQLSLD